MVSLVVFPHGPPEQRHPGSGSWSAGIGPAAASKPSTGWRQQVATSPRFARASHIALNSTRQRSVSTAGCAESNMLTWTQTGSIGQEYCCN
jgi:hypothetical protein